MIGGNVIKPMIKLVKRRSHKAGLPPGTPVFVGEKKVREVRISVLDYDDKKVEFHEDVEVRQCFPFRDSPSVSWINVDGLHEVAVVEELCRHFGIHPLTIEDILNTTQRPKMDVFPDYVYIVLKMLSFNEEAREIEWEQVSIILGKNFVISFQEKSGDVFDPVRNRINSKGRITREGPDHLAYSLVDSVVDNYFSILEKIDEIIEEVEEEVIEDPTPRTLQKIHNLKRELVQFRRTVWPLREIIGGLERLETPLIQSSTVVYLRDLYDHIIQVIETADSQRDIITGTLDVYLSSVSNKLNDIMRFLTIFATIFIPLTLIAGIYGMNFDYMPELKWHYGYFGVLLAMAVVSMSLLIYFRKKKWL